MKTLLLYCLKCRKKLKVKTKTHKYKMWKNNNDIKPYGLWAQGAKYC